MTKLNWEKARREAPRRRRSSKKRFDVEPLMLTPEQLERSAEARAFLLGYEGENAFLAKMRRVWVLTAPQAEAILAIRDEMAATASNR